MAVFRPLESTKVISRKIWVAWNYWTLIISELFCHLDFTWNQYWQIWVSKSVILTISMAPSCIFSHSEKFYCKCRSQKSKFRSCKYIKMALFESLLNKSNFYWYHVKSEWQKKFCNFHTVILSLDIHGMYKMSDMT